MNIKLIALDMDGTTLNTEHQVTPANKEAIKAALSKNVEVVISTGRSNTELFPILKQFPEIRYFICGNGAKIYDKTLDKNIFEDFLPFSVATNLIDIAKDYLVTPEIYVNNHIYTNKHFYDYITDFISEPHLISLIQQSRTPLQDLSDFLQNWQKPIEKINMFYTDENERNRLFAVLNKMDVALTSSLEHNLEINSPTASKGTALHHLCQSLHIESPDVMAIGDGHNDISMLRYAGCSVAMGNAIPSARNAARFTTLTNTESGVAFAINEHVL
ncbi:MAG: Cof-type HAD-IIB family hydrolase [Selenomonadaceae bacterium]